MARCGCSAALDLRGRIFVAGGGESMYKSARAWDSVEWLEENTGQDPGGGGADVWRQGPAMSQARCALGFAVSYLTDHLFAAGGYGGGDLYHDSAERLDLSSGSAGVWEALPRMSCRPQGVQLALNILNQSTYNNY